jgi:hypothetical protein
MEDGTIKSKQKVVESSGANRTGNKFNDGEKFCTVAPIVLLVKIADCPELNIP